MVGLISGCGSCSSVSDSSSSEVSGINMSSAKYHIYAQLVRKNNVPYIKFDENRVYTVNELFKKVVRVYATGSSSGLNVKGKSKGSNKTFRLVVNGDKYSDMFLLKFDDGSKCYKTKEEFTKCVGGYKLFLAK